MKTVKEYIDSGILEHYVLGCTSAEESIQVELLINEYPAIRMEITAIQTALECYAMEHAITPNPVIKPFLLATIDYSERLKKMVSLLPNLLFYMPNLLLKITPIG